MKLLIKIQSKKNHSREINFCTCKIDPLQSQVFLQYMETHAYHDETKKRKPTALSISDVRQYFPLRVLKATQSFENSRKTSLRSWRNNTTSPILWYLKWQKEHMNRMRDLKIKWCYNNIIFYNWVADFLRAHCSRALVYDSIQNISIYYKKLDSEICFSFISCMWFSSDFAMNGPLRLK